MDPTARLESGPTHPSRGSIMKQHELDREIDRLDKVGDRKAVVALMRKYGLFLDEDEVARYLTGGQKS